MKDNKDVVSIIEGIASKHNLTYIVARYAFENNYITLNQFYELGQGLTPEKSLEIINYFVSKFENEHSIEPTLRMGKLDTTNICPTYIMGKPNE